MEAEFVGDYNDLAETMFSWVLLTRMVRSRCVREVTVCLETFFALCRGPQSCGHSDR